MIVHKELETHNCEQGDSQPGVLFGGLAALAWEYVHSLESMAVLTSEGMTHIQHLSYPANLAPCD